MSQTPPIAALASHDAESSHPSRPEEATSTNRSPDSHEPAVTIAERDRLVEELRSDRETLKTMLTERDRAEAALIQSEKLAAVGRLAASISHEINNPLESVTNLLYLIRQEDHLPERALVYLGLAERELARVSEIAGQTLRFQRQSTSPTKVTPKDLLDSVVALYQGRLINGNIKLTFDHQVAAPVTCFEGDIRQVLNNLVGNAIEAMRAGGRLLIRTRDSNCWRTGRAGVRISVADTGSGMPPEVREHIFEAFYTTKGLGGTGIGLWISHGIVQKHTGVLSVRSSNRASRSGTVFSLFLPRELQLAG